MNCTENNAEHEIIEFSFPADGIPERLDRYIGRNSELNITRSRVQKLIVAGLVTVNGQKALHSHILKGGERIIIQIPPQPPLKLRAENIPLDIVYEDEYLLVVNKPAGMVTHPGAGNFEGTLVNALLNYSRQLSGIGGFDRPGIIHRLDKGTSGLILVAKNDDVHLYFQTELQQRRIKKTYLTLVCGHMKQDSGFINLPIGRSLKDRKKMTVTNVKGRSALTEYRLLDRFRLYDFLEIGLHTGRTHQIRVHFSHLGHPVFGDADYGGRQKWHKGIFSPDRIPAAQALELMPRQALHSARLEFIHPVAKKAIFLDCPLPEDFNMLLDFLKKKCR